MAFFFSNERIGVINVYFHHPGLSLAASFAGGGKVIRAAGFFYIDLGVCVSLHHL